MARGSIVFILVALLKITFIMASLIGIGILLIFLLLWAITKDDK
jgi:hypothetical protein